MGFRVYDPAKAEFVFIAKAIGRTGALLKCFLEWIGFVWQEWWKTLPESQNSGFSQEYMLACPIVSCDNHPWEQYDECKKNNQQFQDQRWGCRYSCRNWAKLWLVVSYFSHFDICIQKWKKVNSQFILQPETIGSTKNFHSHCEKKFAQKRFHNFFKYFFLVVPFATSQCKTPLFSQMVPSRLLEMTNFRANFPLKCCFADYCSTPQQLTNLNAK